MRTALSQAGSAVAAAVWSRVIEFGRVEAVLALALVLLTVAAWPRLGRQALAIPGLVLLWIALPSRVAFIARPPAPPAKKGHD